MRMNTRLDAPVHNRYRVACSSFKGYLGASFTCIKDDVPMDPPYNTGKDFVYKDDFRDNVANYKRITGQVDDEGHRTGTNSESNGRFHTDWLNMMYPRLRLARNLLSDDGVILINIDDNEQDNLKKICDEVFGAGNFTANIVW